MIRPLASALTLLVVCSGLLHAEVRTLTDQFGRSITADVLALDGDTLKIRRDDGIVFDFPIGNLSADDQKAIREWAAKQTKKVEVEFTPDPKLLPASISRVKLKSTTLSQYGTDYKYVSEQWGYSVNITNKTRQTVADLRIEYNLFATKNYYVSDNGVISGSIPFDAIRPNDTANVKTKGIEVRKEKSSWWGNSGGDVNGIWVRVYYKDQLLHEIISPESLKDTESWKKVSK